MIDHITIYVHDLDASYVFYAKALAVLGMKVNLGGAEEGLYGFGVGNEPEFEISAGRVLISQANDARAVTPRVHIAFRARDQKTVQLFYEAAMGVSGLGNGPPGPRPDYGGAYYAAFVLDPDGNNIEVVTFSVT